MTDEFRTAFQELIDTAVAAESRFPSAVQQVYQLASHVPTEERELAIQALGPVIAGDHGTPGIIADLMVLSGALVEMGTEPGETGTHVLHRLVSAGQEAAGFLAAWNSTGGGQVPAPDEVTDVEQRRIATEVGAQATTMTVAWWTIRRCAVATTTMLNESGVRATVRADASLHAELMAIANQLAGVLREFDEIRVLLRMAEATSTLVLDRASGRGFRVVFDGIGDNFQLHTLLADALISQESMGLAGRRPDPRWTAAYRSSDPDPQAHVVQGWWNLLAADGSWVRNEGVPADIPTVDGEHVVVLDEQSPPRSWNAGRRHPRVTGWLDVDEELTAAERAAWWQRVAPSGSPRPTEANARHNGAPTHPAEVDALVSGILDSVRSSDSADTPADIDQGERDDTSVASEDPAGQPAWPCPTDQEAAQPAPEARVAPTEALPRWFPGSLRLRSNRSRQRGWPLRGWGKNASTTPMVGPIWGRGTVARLARGFFRRFPRECRTVPPGVLPGCSSRSLILGFRRGGGHREVRRRWRQRRSRNLHRRDHRSSPVRRSCPRLIYASTV